MCAAVCRYKTYFVYGTFCICAAINVFFMFPETKGRTLEEMDDLFAAGHAFSAWRLSSVPKKTLAEVEAEVYVLPVSSSRARAHRLLAHAQGRLGHAQRGRQQAHDEPHREVVVGPPRAGWTSRLGGRSFLFLALLFFSLHSLFLLDLYLSRHSNANISAEVPHSRLCPFST